MVLFPVCQGIEVSDCWLSSIMVFLSTCTDALARHAAIRVHCASIRMAAVPICSSDVNPQTSCSSQKFLMVMCFGWRSRKDDSHPNMVLFEQKNSLLRGQTNSHLQ